MDRKDIPIADSVIDEVTVYRENALITRKTELTADSEEAVKIIGLPLSLDDSSIRIRIDSASAELKASDFSVIMEAPEPDSDLPAPSDEELENLRHENNRYDIRLRLVESSMERLRSLPFSNRPVPSDTQIPSPSPIASRTSMMEHIDNRMTTLQKKHNTLLKEKNKVYRKLVDLQERINSFSTARQNREQEIRKSVIVKLDGAEKADKAAVLYLDYLIPGARWYPVYGLNITNDFCRYSLNMRAMIRQGSGEDWHDVKVKLSTAAAVQWMEKPVLNSKIYGRPAPTLPVSGWRKPPEGISALFADYDNFIEHNSLIGNNRSAVFGALSEDAPEPDIEPPVPDEYNDDEILYEREEMDEIMADDEYPEEVMKKQMSMRSTAMESASSAPPPVARKRKSSKSELGLLDAPSPFEEPADDKSEIYGADSVFLEYDKMRLEGVDSNSRGRLKRSSLYELYNTTPEKSRKIEETVSRIRESRNDAPPYNCIKPLSYDGFDYSFATDSRVDIPSDGNYHTRLISSDESEGKMTYITVPRESRDVFRYIRFDNPLDAPVLAGPVDLSIDSSYLLSSNLDTVPPGGAISMGAGIEQSIKVSRNTYYKEETSGLIKGNLGLNHQIDIEVDNNLKRAADMEIRERLPIASGEKDENAEKIKIVVKDVSPDWDAFLQEPYYTNGTYRWQSRIEAGSKKKYTVTYEIQIPSQFELVGGNRREN